MTLKILFLPQFCLEYRIFLKHKMEQPQHTTVQEDQPPGEELKHQIRSNAQGEVLGRVYSSASEDSMERSWQHQQSYQNELQFKTPNKFLFEEEEGLGLPNFQEINTQLQQLSEEPNKERKSLIILNLNEKLEQASKIMGILESNIEEYKEENQILSQKTEELERQFKRHRDEAQRERNLTKSTEEELRHHIQQLQSKLFEIEEVNSRDVYALNEEIHKIQEEKDILIQIRQQQEKTISALEEEIEVIYLYTNFDSKKISKLKKKKSLENKPAEEQLVKKKCGRRSLQYCESPLGQILEEDEEDQGLLGKIRVCQSQEFLEKAQSKEKDSELTEKQRISASNHTSERDNKQNEELSLAHCINQFKLKLQKYGSSEDNQASNSCSAEEIDKEIKNLKNEMQKKSSMFSMEHEQSIESSSVEEIENIQPLNNNQQLLQIKAMIAKKRASQSMRASSVLFKLDQNRSSSHQYQSQLEQQIARLEKKLETVSFTYQLQIKQLNDKIDELLQKIEEHQQQRVRSLSKIDQQSAKIQQKANQSSILFSEAEKLKSEGFEISRLLDDTKTQLELKITQIVSLEDEIKELQCENEHHIREKNKLQQQYDDSLIIEKTLQEKIEELQQQLSSFSNRDQQDSQSKNPMVKYDEDEYQRIIEELEEQIWDKIQQEKQYAKEVDNYRQLTNKLEKRISELQKRESEQEETVKKLEQDNLIFHKKCQDLKYLTQVLKRDAIKVKEIQQSKRNRWEGNTPSLNASSFLKKSPIFQKDTYKPIQIGSRVKVHSFTYKETKQNQPSRIKYQNQSISYGNGLRQSRLSFSTAEQNHTASSFTELVKKKYMM